jgi:hypothetical protein
MCTVSQCAQDIFPLKYAFRPSKSSLKDFFANGIKLLI